MAGEKPQVWGEIGVSPPFCKENSKRAREQLCPQLAWEAAELVCPSAGFLRHGHKFSGVHLALAIGTPEAVLSIQQSNPTAKGTNPPPNSSLGHFLLGTKIH